MHEVGGSASLPVTPVPCLVTLGQGSAVRRGMCSNLTIVAWHAVSRCSARGVPSAFGLNSNRDSPIRVPDPRHDCAIPPVQWVLAAFGNGRQNTRVGVPKALRSSSYDH